MPHVAGCRPWLAICYNSKSKAKTSSIMGERIPRIIASHDELDLLRTRMKYGCLLFWIFPYYSDFFL
ncbi:hypothetical protein BVC71_13835 [Marivivens niveibacter]|uniref:Uncharacterized protein n=1 Tax=Marivivens niveibacter TaxID=1930667 RepID=A0A251WUT6_9RHOB|nr:hypothetical protein BVC71_13835 [Marivivens niveibacter]